jgi:hypothetical protein
LSTPQKKEKDFCKPKLEKEEFIPGKKLTQN